VAGVCWLLAAGCVATYEFITAYESNLPIYQDMHFLVVTAACSARLPASLLHPLLAVVVSLVTQLCTSQAELRH